MGNSGRITGHSEIEPNCWQYRDGRCKAPVTEMYPVAQLRQHDFARIAASCETLFYHLAYIVCERTNSAEYLTPDI